MEIERKFLVSELPFDLTAYPCRHLTQRYISTDPVVRVRACTDTGTTYELTCKGRGLMSREEINLPLEREAYERLAAKTEGRAIVKRRYLIPLDGELLCELDVFEGDLAPLVLAEVEFDSEKSARTFTPPSWMGKEVTDQPAYQNVSLSINGKP